MTAEHAQGRKNRQGGLNALALGFGLLLATLAFAAYGGWSAWTAWGQADAARPTDVTSEGVVIAAKARGEAEAMALRRLVAVLRDETLELKAGSFKASADARLVSMSFDAEGSPDAVWRAIHALEAGAPAMVLTRLRLTARDQGAVVSVSADALAAWAIPDAASAQRAAPVAAPAAPAAPEATPSPVGEAPK